MLSNLESLWNELASVRNIFLRKPFLSSPNALFLRVDTNTGSLFGLYKCVGSNIVFLVIIWFKNWRHSLWLLTGYIYKCMFTSIKWWRLLAWLSIIVIVRNSKWQQYFLSESRETFGEETNGNKESRSRIQCRMQFVDLHLIKMCWLKHHIGYTNFN